MAHEPGFGGGLPEESPINEIDYLKWYVQGFSSEDLKNPDALRLLTEGYTRLNDALLTKGEITPEDRALLEKYETLIRRAHGVATGPIPTYVYIIIAVVVLIIILMLLLK